MKDQTVKQINKYYDARPQLLRPESCTIFGFITDSKMDHFLDYIVEENEQNKIKLKRGDKI